MSALAGVLSGLPGRDASEEQRDSEGTRRLAALLQRAEPLASAWAKTYDTAWALDDSISRSSSAARSPS